MAMFTNYATLHYQGRSVHSNTVTGEILETLSAAKTAAAESYTPGEDLSYVLSLVNSGTTDLSGLTVTDDLGAYEVEGTTVYPLALEEGSLRLFVNGVLQSAPTVTAGPPLTVTGLTVPAGGSLLLVYEALPTEYAPPTADGSILNTATVTGPGLAVPVTASAEVPAAQTARLTVRKALSPAIVPPLGELSYSFTLENSGNSPVTAAENAALQDVFDPILTGISVSLDGTPWAAGVNYSYVQATGEFTTLPGQIAVPAASFTQNEDGSWTLTPGSVTLTVTGTLQS